MTHIIVKNLAQDRYVMSYIIFMGIIHKSHFLFLMLISVKRHSTLSENLWFVCKGEDISSLK